MAVHECEGITRLHVTASQPGGKLTWPLLAALDEAWNSMAADR
jgi:hypothetical protein